MSTEFGTTAVENFFDDPKYYIKKAGNYHRNTGFIFTSPNGNVLLTRRDGSHNITREEPLRRYEKNPRALDRAIRRAWEQANTDGATIALKMSFWSFRMGDQRAVAIITRAPA